MERSHSYTSFDTSNNSNNNCSSISSNSNCSHIDNCSSSNSNLRKVIEMRQTQLQQLKQHSGSSDNVNALNAANLTLLQTMSGPMRRKLLQRQKSTEFLDDIEYAADREEYEEEEEEDDDEVFAQAAHEIDANINIVADISSSSSSSPASIALAIIPNHKHLHFQTHKPQSDTALLIDASKNSSSLKTIKHQLKQKQSSLDSATLNMSKKAQANMSPQSKRHACGALLKRNNSIHSDSSRYSSVDSLLEARKPDPEAILINLGFGPMPGSEDILSKIPKRFLKPSQVRGIDTDAFVKRLQLANTLADHSALGYRGLIGNPDIPPSTIVAKIMERFEVNQRKKSMGSVEHTIR